MKSSPATARKKPPAPVIPPQVLTRLQALTAANQKLADEVIRRRAAETSLRRSERRQRLMLGEAKLVQVQMRNLSRRLLHAQEEERHRISRELHDDVLQTLVGINVQLETLLRETQTDYSQFKAKVVKAQNIVADSVSSVHRFARELRPMILDDLGLLPAIRSQLDEFRKRTKILVRLSADAEVEALNDDRRTAIYRVIQASLSNVAHHSGALRATVSIRVRAKTIVLKVHDAGKSFDVARTLDARRYKRLGLLGMRERVEMVGGTFTITSSPALGTTVQVEFSHRRRSRKHIRPPA